MTNKEKEKYKQNIHSFHCSRRGGEFNKVIFHSDDSSAFSYVVLLIFFWMEKFRMEEIVDSMKMSKEKN